MATLEEIKNKLNIVVGDREINPGLCQDTKNRYYNINNEYLVVEFLHDKHAVFSNDAKTRELLSNRIWHIKSDGYTKNAITGLFHKQYLDDEIGLVADHKNRLRYDNRQSNLRIITPQQNMRNKTKYKQNTSGKSGVKYLTARGHEYWQAIITDNEGNRISKQFSIARHGAEEAKRLAIEQRLAWQREFNYDGE